MHVSVGLFKWRFCVQGWHLRRMAYQLAKEEHVYLDTLILVMVAGCSGPISLGHASSYHMNAKLRARSEQYQFTDI